MPFKANAHSATSTIVAWTLLIGTLCFYLVWTVMPSAHRLTDGFMAYYVGGQTVLHYQLPHLYEHDWFDDQVQLQSNGKVRDIFFANTPIIAAAWTPLAALDVAEARAIWIWLNVIMIGAALWLIATGLSSTPTIWGVALLAALLTLPTPSRHQMLLGQMYGMLLLLHALGWRAYIADRDKVAGIALGFAVALKLSGWPIGLLMLVHRRWRALLYAIGTVVAAAMVTLPFVGVGAWREFFMVELPYALSRPEISLSAFQTSAGLWQHLFRFDATFNPNPVVNLPWLATLLTIGTTIAACAALILRSRPAYRSFAAAIAMTELLSPAAEQYHYIVLMLPLAVLWRDSWTLKSKLFLFVAASATLLLSAPLGFIHYTAGWLALTDYPRLCAGWLVVVALLSLPPSKSPTMPLQPLRQQEAS